jgi:two-component system response regulator AlgR
MTLQLLIVDDEPLARLRLRGLVEANEAPKAEVAGEASNAAEAIAWLAAHPCDALLLDIHMPGRDGLQLAAEIARAPQRPAVVFVTAHAEHALQAFELEAVDYLTKPVRRERLQAALQRIAARRPTAPEAAAGAEPPVIVVSDRGRLVRVPVAEVLYLKAELKYVTLRTAQASYVLDESLSELEGRFGANFLRVHRNALVARRAVRALEKRFVEGEADDGGETWAVRVAPVDEWLAVSRRQAASVREALTGVA